jgi:hypothetical protein
MSGYYILGSSKILGGHTFIPYPPLWKRGVGGDEVFIF